MQKSSESDQIKTYALVFSELINFCGDTTGRLHELHLHLCLIFYYLMGFYDTFRV